MARHLRVEFSGAICHVTCRMIGDARLERIRLFSGRRRDSELRAVAAHCLMRYAGQTQREVARFLEAGSGSAISKQLTRRRDGFQTLSPDVLTRVEKRLQSARRDRAQQAKS